MMPKRAIELAIEGGWLKHYGTFTGVLIEQPLYRLGFKGSSNTPNVIIWEWYRIALDPTFWQALGKALGWDVRPDITYPYWWSVEHEGDNFTLLDDWQNAAHRFYNLILTGDDTVKFWNELLAPKDK